MIRTLTTFGLSLMLFPLAVLTASENPHAAATSPQKEQTDRNLPYYLERIDYFSFLNEDSCLYFADKAYTESVIQKNKPAQARALSAIISSYQAKGEYSKALELCSALKDIARELDDNMLLGKAHQFSGSIYLEMGIFDASYDNLLSALGIYSNASEKEAETARENSITAYNALAVLYAKQSRFDKAQEYISLGLAKIDTATDADEIHKKLRTKLNNNLALCYLYSGEEEKGVQLLKDQIDFVSRDHIPYNLSSLQLTLCRIYIEQGEYALAEEEVKAALHSAAERRNALSQAQSLYYLGYLYFITSRNDSALQYFESTYRIATQLGLLDIRAYTAGHIAVLHEQAGNYQEAYRNAMLLNRLKDSLNQKSNRENLYQIHQEYQYRQYLEQIKTENKKRTVSWVASMLIVAFALMFVWAFISRQRLRIKNIRLQQDKIASELETKKKEITTKTIYLQQKNETIADIASRLSKAKHLFKTTNQPIIEDIIRELSSLQKDSSWDEFELRFEQVHTDFFKKLQEKYPNLSPAEKRLCAFLKLNMNSKEIATLLHTTVGNVEQTRFRLRKKLGLHGTDSNLTNFIESL